MHRTESGTTGASRDDRGHEIRQLLVTRRHELLNEIRHRVRDARQAGAGSDHAAAGRDDTTEVDAEDDLAFALIHLKGELLARIDAAVRRCDDGTYGSCLDCGEGIAPARLRAIPFAVRCRGCEETREAEPRRARTPAHRTIVDTFV